REQLPQSVWEGNGPLPIGSCGRPIIPDPAGQAFLADLAGGEREDDGGGVLRFRIEANPVLQKEDPHRQESDALVAVDKRMIFGKPERVSRSEFGQLGPFIPPLVDRALQRRPQHALVAQAWRTAEAA